MSSEGSWSMHVKLSPLGVLRRMNWMPLEPSARQGSKGKTYLDEAHGKVSKSLGAEDGRVEPKKQNTT